MKKLALFIFFISVHVNAQTCVEEFTQNYVDYDTYLKTVYQCDSEGNGRNLTVKPGAVIKLDDGLLYYRYSWEARMCSSGVLTNSGDYDFPLCELDHQVASGPVRSLELPNRMCGSVILPEEQIVGESIPVVGSQITLNYFSNWVEGRIDDNKIDLRFTGASPSGDIPSGRMKIIDGVATLYDSGVLSGTIPNQSYSYTWTVPPNSIGAQLVKAGAQYSHPRPPDPPIEIGMFREFALGSYRSKNDAGLGAWIPNTSAFYDINAEKVYFGSGDISYDTPKKLGTYPNEYYHLFSKDGSLLYVFNSDGRLKYLKTGRLGTILETYNYNAYGLVSIQYPFSRTLTINRDSIGKPTSITAPNGQTTSLSMNLSGFLESLTTPNSETYSMTYVSNGLLKTFQKPNGEISTFDYSSGGRLIKDSHSGGYYTNITKTAQDLFDSTVEVTTPMSRKTTLEVAGRGYDSLVQSMDPLGVIHSSRVYSGASGENIIEFAKWDNVYTSTSIVDPYFNGFRDFNSSVSLVGLNLGSISTEIASTVTLTDPNDPFSYTSWQTQKLINGSNILTTIFNPSLKKYSSTSSMGKTSEVTVDTYERISTSKIGSLYQKNFNYTNEKLTSLTQNTRTTSFGYNTADLLSSVTNNLSQTTSFGYDLAGRLTTITLPDTRVITYSYNSNGILTGVTPPGRTIHTYGFNAKELLTSYQPPTLSGVSVVNTTYSYNNDKQLAGIARPDGANVSFTYNATTGFLSSYTTPDGTFTQTKHAATGKPAQVTLPDGRKTKFTYTDGILTEVQNLTSANANLGRFRNNYTNQMITGDSVIGTTTSTIAYQYNTDYELKKAGDVNIAYHVPSGYMTGTTMGSGTTGFTDTYSYNTYGEMTGYQAKRGTTVIYDLTLTRDGIGGISGKTQTMNSVTDNFVYTFDSAGRLTQTDKNSSTVATYAYDSNGNRNGGTIGVQPTSATYDAQDRMNTYNSLSFTYNANGDLTSKTNSVTSQTTNYTYDVFGNLRQVNLPGGTIVSYEIDSLNRRVARLVNGTVLTRYVYMDQTRIAAELSAAGVITKRFVYGSKGNVPDYMIISGVNYRIISDHLGSLRLVVRQSDGVIMQRMNHDEFGRVTEDTNPGYVPFGFAGGFYDYQTGLVRFGARDYDPEIGRWTSKDPILFGGGDTNIFGYVQNDPVNFIDPEGTFPWAIVGAFVGSYFWSTPTDTPGAADSELWQVPAAGLMCGAAAGGKEIAIGSLRIAPFGNRTKSPTGQLPHYHRNVPNPNKPGQSIPGQGIGRHRPWDVKSPDKSFWDRF